MQPITYFVSTPAIEEISRTYGDDWTNLALKDRLCIATGLIQCLLMTVGYGQDCDLVHACIEHGHQFGVDVSEVGDTEEHLQVITLLKQLDDELTSKDAARLVQGLMQQATH